MAEMIRRGEVVYSPIVHFHALSVVHNLPGDFEFWKRINLSMLDKADKLYVLKIKGWEESKGLTAEIEHADANGTGVFYWDVSNWLGENYG